MIFECFAGVYLMLDVDIFENFPPCISCEVDDVY